MIRISILVITSWLLVFTAHAVGISVSPRELVLHEAPNKKITGTFTVMNPSRETVIYEVGNDSLLPLAITPTTFLLAPSQSATITVEYRSNNSTINHVAIQQSTTNLSILGRPLTVQPTQAASGIKLPVTISAGQVAGAAAARDDPSTAGAVLITILLILLTTFMATPRRRSHAAPLH